MMMMVVMIVWHKYSSILPKILSSIANYKGFTCRFLLQTRALTAVFVASSPPAS